MDIKSILAHNSKQRELQEERDDIEKAILVHEEAFLKEVEKDYTIERLEGAPYVYFREKWGDFDNDKKEGNIEANDQTFSYLKPHTIENGRFFNKLLHTEYFNENDYYLSFYIPDSHDVWMWDEEYKGLKKNQPIYEIMIFKLSDIEAKKS